MPAPRAGGRTVAVRYIARRKRRRTRTAATGSSPGTGQTATLDLFNEDREQAHAGWRTIPGAGTLKRFRMVTVASALETASDRMNFLSLFGTKRSRRPNGFGSPTTLGPSARSATDSKSEVLSDLAHSWVRELPLASRPLELCNVYPRVANRIAESWGNPTMTTAVLDDLLVDHRGGRKGFPVLVATELLRLEALHEQRDSASSGG